MSRFTDHLDVRLLEGADGKPLLKDGRCQWVVDSPLIYQVGAAALELEITVPAGTVTDLASIPRLFWRIFPPDGPWLKAAVVHDYLYVTKGEAGLFSRKDADRILLEAMTVLGVDLIERQVIYHAVRLGGAGGWGR